MTEDISNWTLTGLVQRQAEAFGEREFMSFEHGTVLTFGSLHRDSDQLARTWPTSAWCRVTGSW
jgi:hypothetical protein